MLRACVVLAIVAVQWAQMEFSCIPIKEMFFLRADMLLVNLLMMALPSLLLAVFLKGWWAALAVTSPLVFLFSAVDYFVTQWHGSPITPTLLRSAATALRVVGAYAAPLTPKMVIKLCVLGGMFLLCMAGVLLLRWLEAVPHSGGRLRAAALRAGLAAAVAAAVWAALLSPAALKPARTVTWGWKAPVEQYGYLPYLLEDWQVSRVPFVVPEGYDPQALAEVPAAPAAALPQTLPDVILILNESFYDLSVYTDLTTDRPYLGQFYALDNALHGYALSPGIGGGTNDTEYELLTSNSTHLLTGSAPFTYLDLTGANSIVSYLRALGYTATAMHSEPGSNYNRNMGYPSLGFEQLAFKEEFEDLDAAGYYFATDASCYENLLRYYQPDSAAPQLLYLLTIQNHGGYSFGDPSLYTVHAEQEFGEMSGEIDEYLSRMALSDAAFADLTAYFEQLDRPVIVCMVGDHAPSFISSLPARPGLSEEERLVYSRAAPFVIWANFPIGSSEVGLVGMTDLMPMLLQAAGLPLTPYYQSILQLQAGYPVRTNDGIWRDAQGSWGSYLEADGWPEPLQRYFFMEYNNLEEKERIQALFEPAR